MIIVAVLSQKGGAGKTTIALNLGLAAELDGKTAAIVDLDPQASITQWGDSRSNNTPAVVSAQAARLPQILQACEENGTGLVLIDTAPHAERAALAAARAADAVLIPCRPSMVDLRAIGSTIDICRIAGVKARVVLNQTPARGRLAADAAEAVRELGVDVSPAELGHRIAFVHAITKGQGVQEFEPHGKAAAEVLALYRDLVAKGGREYA